MYHPDRDAEVQRGCTNGIRICNRDLSLGHYNTPDPSFNSECHNFQSPGVITVRRVYYAEKNFLIKT